MGVREDRRQEIKKDVMIERAVMEMQTGDDFNGKGKIKKLGVVVD